jgi:hypothetical protein
MPRPLPVTSERLPVSSKGISAWQDTFDADDGGADPRTSQ